MMLFCAFIFCFVLQMCVLYDNILSRCTARYTGVALFASVVPFQVTFNSRLASLFLRWKEPTCLLDGCARSWFTCNMLSWFSDVSVTSMFCPELLYTMGAIISQYNS